MEHRSSFGETVEKYKIQSGLSYPQISDRSQGQLSGKTIINWVNTNVRRPRDWQPIIHFCLALQLNEAEANEVLQSGHHKPIAELKQVVTDDADRRLLEYWRSHHYLNQAPRLEPVFIGRDQEIRFAKQALLTNHRTLSIFGLGGVGKSTLAIKIADQLHSFFPDGVLWAAVSHRLTVSSIQISFASAFGVDLSNYDTDERRAEVLRRVLAAKRCLVVLDDISTYEALDLLLPAKGLCSVLVTTRNRQLAGFTEQSIGLIPFDQEQGKTLLRGILTPARVNQEIDEAQRLIQFVDGLPLALRIIGQTLKSNTHITLKQFADLIASEENRLSALERWDQHSRGVRAVFEVSWGMLHPESQALLASLSIFEAHRFTFESLFAAHGSGHPAVEVQLALGQLANFSLVHIQEVDDAYRRPYHRMHVLVHLFAREKRGDDQGAWIRYSRYLSDSLTGWSQQQIDEEWLNILGAAKWTQENERPLFAKLIEKLTIPDISYMGYLDQRGYWQEAIDWLSKIDVGEEQPLKAGWHYLKRAVFAFRKMNIEEAMSLTQQSLSLAETLYSSIDQALLMARICEQLARFSIEKDLEESLGWIEKGQMALADFLNHDQAQWSTGMLDVTTSTAWLRLGSKERAFDAAERALKSLPPANPSMLGAMMNLGAVRYHQGSIDEAAHYFEQGQALAAKLGDRRQEGTFTMNVGVVAQKVGDLEKAIECQERAQIIFREIGHVDREGDTHNNLGMIYYIRGDDERVVAEAQQAIMLAEEEKLWELEGYALTTMARSLIRKGKLEDAKDCLSRAYQICLGHRGFEELRASVQHNRASLQALNSNDLEALQLGTQFADDAIEIAAAGEYLLEEGIAWKVKGEIFALRGDLSKANDAFETCLLKLKDQEAYELARAQLAYISFAIDHRTNKVPVSTLKKVFAHATDVFHQLGSRIELAQCNQLEKFLH